MPESTTTIDQPTPFQAKQIARGRGHHLHVGRYVLLERVGRGGMGQVFRARHTHFGKEAAVKLVRLERHKCPHTARRALRETRLVSRMNHPNVVHALDAGPIRGTYYLALEFVPGPDLGQVLREYGPLPIAVACEYARQAALGLDHIHSRGVVHRDVKPSNLGLADGGRVVKVLDFGLARRSGRRKPPAGDAVKKFVGSADFAAPEQASDPGRVDARSDVYALGATLYFLLTGQVPFPGGTSLDKLKRCLRETPPAVCELRPDVPTELGELVGRMMAKKPNDRPATARLTAEELARFAVPITTPTAPPATPGTDVPTVADQLTLSNSGMGEPGA
jgi:serine/threonine protein kinase